MNYPKTLSAAVAAALKSFKISSPKILVIGLGPRFFFGGWIVIYTPEKEHDLAGKGTLNEDVFPFFFFENGDVPMSC